jgi:glyoxylase-like metal-dependent hydrolase (beta-lactamase superfamily II)
MKGVEMELEIITIALHLPYQIGLVNCYLLKASTGCILIDTGSANQRRKLEGILASRGCNGGKLKLIILTHGDFDHIGNAAHLREMFGAPIAMHADDSGMALHGDMFWNRKSGTKLLRTLIPLFFGFGKSNRFEPDVFLGGGESLRRYGLDASVVSIPGHSRGSIGVLTAAGDLFCGDLFENTHGPGINSIMDDLPAAETSIAKLSSSTIHNVYPGHGSIFQMDQILTREESAKRN